MTVTFNYSFDTLTTSKAIPWLVSQLSFVAVGIGGASFQHAAPTGEEGPPGDGAISPALAERRPLGLGLRWEGEVGVGCSVW